MVTRICPTYVPLSGKFIYREDYKKRGKTYEGSLSYSMIKFMGDFDIAGTTIKKGLWDIPQGGTLILRGTEIEGDCNLKGIIVEGRTILEKMKVKGILDLRGAFIESSCFDDFGDFEVGAYKIDSKTRIPKGLIDVLRQYKKIEESSIFSIPKGLIDILR